MASNNKIKRYVGSAWIDVIDGDDYVLVTDFAAHVTDNDLKDVPPAGTTGQVLVKKTGTDYDTEWKSSGVPTAGVLGDVLTKTSGTDYAMSWAPPTNRFGTATENVEVFPTVDDKLRLVENTVDGRPYLSFYNQNTAGALTRKGLIGQPEAHLDASDIYVRSDSGNLQLQAPTAAKNVLVNGNRVLTVADMTSSGGNVGISGTLSAASASITGDVTAATAHLGGIAGDALFIGNDSKLVDINVANTFGVQGITSAATGAIRYGSAGPTVSGTGGTLAINAGVDAINIGDIYGGGWATVDSTAGYLLLGNANNVNSPIYFRSRGTGVVYIGATGTNTLQVGNATVSVSGTLSSSGALTGPEVHTNAWFRNNAANTGLYNQVNGTGVYGAVDWVRNYGSSNGFYASNVNGHGGGAITSDGTAWAFIVRSNSLGTYAVWSSTREIKRDIQPFTDHSEIIDALQPVTFREKYKEEDTQETKDLRDACLQYGFIAEEVAEVNPHLASWDETLTKPVSWDFTSIIAIAVAELKSLRARVSALEAALEVQS